MENQNQESFQEKLQNLNETPDTTQEYDKDDIENNKIMGVLAYLGILVLIPIFAAKDSKFARFHSNQGLVLCIACFAWYIIYEIIVRIIFSISWRLGFISTILRIVYIVFFILAVIGIVNALNGRAKELPVIGKYRLLK